MLRGFEAQRLGGSEAQRLGVSEAQSLKSFDALAMHWLLAGCCPGLELALGPMGLDALGDCLAIPGGRDPTRCPLHAGGSWETISALRL